MIDTQDPVKDLETKTKKPKNNNTNNNDNNKNDIFPFLGSHLKNTPNLIYYVNFMNHVTDRK